MATRPAKPKRKAAEQSAAATSLSDVKARIRDIENTMRQNIKKSFDVRRYDRQSSLNLLQWCHQLMFRAMLQIYAEKTPRHTFCAGSEYEFDFLRLISMVIEDPLKRTNQTEPFLRSIHHRSVSDVSVGDIFSTASTLDWNDPSLRKAHDELLAFDDQAPQDGSKEALDKIDQQSLHEFIVELGSSYDRDIYARIDLTSTDERIVEDFRHWLNQKRAYLKARRGRHSVRKFTQADLHQWANMQVLAYIDLKMLAGTLGVRIPFHMFGELLFPDEIGVDTTERVRKNVAPLAAYLMDSAILDAMESQAASEVRKKT
jgi:hypothetical protein